MADVPPSFIGLGFGHAPSSASASGASSHQQDTYGAPSSSSSSSIPQHQHHGHPSPAEAMMMQYKQYQDQLAGNQFPPTFQDNHQPPPQFVHSSSSSSSTKEQHQQQAAAQPQQYMAWSQSQSQSQPSSAFPPQIHHQQQYHPQLQTSASLPIQQSQQQQQQPHPNSMPHQHQQQYQQLQVIPPAHPPVIPSAAAVSAPTPTPTPTNASSSAAPTDIVAAVAAAKRIAASFASAATTTAGGDVGGAANASSGFGVGAGVGGVFPAAATTTPQHHEVAAEARRARERCLEVERDKLSRATLRNFEYVAERDEVRLQGKLVELQKVRQGDDSAGYYGPNGGNTGGTATGDRRRDAALRKATSKAGVGTRTRSDAVDAFGHQGRQQQKRRGGNNNASIYVSGLIIKGNRGGDGDVDNDEPGAETERTLRSLFGAFGSVRKVTIYRDQRSGVPKGDALVVYEGRSSAGDASEATTTASSEVGTGESIDVDGVCSQLNGAVLPCGSTLSVQPANFDWKKKQQRSFGPEGEGGQRTDGEQRSRESERRKVVSSSSGGQSEQSYYGPSGPNRDGRGCSSESSAVDVGYYGPAGGPQKQNRGNVAATGVVEKPKSGGAAATDAAPPLEAAVNTKQECDGGEEGAGSDLDDFFASL